MREGVRRTEMERVILSKTKKNKKTQVSINLIALLGQNTELAMTHILYYPDKRGDCYQYSIICLTL